MMGFPKNSPEAVLEAELHEWLDGQLAADRRKYVAVFLAEQPESDARIAQWRRQNRMIRSAFKIVVPLAPLYEDDELLEPSAIANFSLRGSRKPLRPRSPAAAGEFANARLAMEAQAALSPPAEETVPRLSPMIPKRLPAAAPSQHFKFGLAALVLACLALASWLNVEEVARQWQKTSIRAPNDTLVSRMLRAQRVAAAAGETLQVKGNNPAPLWHWLTQRTGLSMAAESFSGLGVELRAAQIVSLDGMATPLLTLQKTDGEKIAVVIAPASSGDRAQCEEPPASSFNSEVIAFLCTQTARIGVIGPAGNQGLARIAERTAQAAPRFLLP